MSQQLYEINPAIMHKTLTPRVLFEQLNLLTFNNIDHQRSRYLNTRYLSELYPESSVTLTEDELSIEHETTVVNIRIVNKNTIEIHNRATDATYNSTHLTTVYYDPVAKEIRQGTPAHCNLCSQGQRPDYSSTTSSENLSYGEIKLTSKVNAVSIPVFNKPNGIKSGSFNIEVKYKIDEPTGEAIVHSIVRLCDSDFQTLTEPSFVVRLKYEESLLYFDKQQHWLNLSFDPKTPAWISIDDLPNNLSQSIQSRENIMLNGTNIVVKSPHRLRAEPNTNSDILHVLDSSDSVPDAAIEPIEIKGDWMKVDYITANPNINAKPIQYTTLTGWIKWREMPGKEYVNVEYQLEW